MDIWRFSFRWYQSQVFLGKEIFGKINCFYFLHIGRFVVYFTDLGLKDYKTRRA